MHQSDRPTLLVGHTDHVTSGHVAACVARRGASLESFDTGARAVSWAENHDLHSIIIRQPVAQSEALLLSIRSTPRLSRVPVMFLNDDVTELSFAQLYALGADDCVVLGDREGLQRRLLSIPADLPLSAPASRGTAVLAHGDQRQRLLVARVLRNAGFDVRFAIEATELSAAAAADGIVLVVADWQLEGGAAGTALRLLRGEGSTVPWVIMSPPKSLHAVSSSVADLARVVVHDSFAPHENLHFVANEILQRTVSEQRASPRLLYGTLVAFRVAGRDRDRLGYAYNISAEGIYVRTLDPLMRDEDAWLEFTPPRTGCRVRVEGKVAWSRTMGGSFGATVPPGFGVQIMGGSTSDLERFRSGYQAFASDLAGTRWSCLPPPGGVL